MGDIADDIIDGIFDYETGEYLGEGVGYPRTSRDMHDDNSLPYIKHVKTADVKVGKQYKYKGMIVTVIERIRGNPRNISVLNDPCARSQRRFRLDTGDIVFAKQLFL